MQYVAELSILDLLKIIKIPCISVFLNLFTSVLLITFYSYVPSNGTFSSLVQVSDRSYLLLTLAYFELHQLDQRLSWSTIGVDQTDSIHQDECWSVDQCSCPLCDDYLYEKEHKLELLSYVLHCNT